MVRQPGGIRMSRSIRCVQSFAILCLGAAFTLLAGCGGGPVPAPTAYKPFDWKDGGWGCEVPEGWDAQASGKKNSSAKFTKGSAKISLRTDVSGSLMADMGSGGYNKLGPPSDEDFPVHKAHLMGKDAAAQEFGDYKEEGEITKFSNAIGGEGRKSEFTASAGLSGAVKGYRATFLSRDRRFQVFCTCRESDWKALKPAFEKVLESFHSAG
jgi:hypothetical protein